MERKRESSIKFSHKKKRSRSDFTIEAKFTFHRISMSRYIDLDIQTRNHGGGW